MVTSPYRDPAPPPEPPQEEPAAAFDIVGVVALVWIVTALRVGASLLRVEAPSREIDCAWVVLFLATAVLWKELATHRRARVAPRATSDLARRR